MLILGGKLNVDLFVNAWKISCNFMKVAILIKILERFIKGISRILVVNCEFVLASVLIKFYQTLFKFPI